MAAEVVEGDLAELRGCPVDEPRCHQVERAEATERDNGSRERAIDGERFVAAADARARIAGAIEQRDEQVLIVSADDHLTRKLDGIPI